MAVACTWADDEETIITFHFVGSWTWEEYYQADSQMRLMMHVSQKPTSLIMDFSDSHSMPASSIKEIRKLSQNRDNHIQSIFIVHGNHILMMIGTLMSKLLPQESVIVTPCDTVADALTLIQQRRVGQAQDSAYYGTGD